jgi:dihydrofolate synthase/folylpolyglutamate synthase
MTQLDDLPVADMLHQRLERLNYKLIDLSLGRVEALLGKLGHPERRLPPVFHVAGTNGKGSTIAFLRAFLEAAGWRVHSYTSPHLVHFNERIRLAASGGGQLIDDAALLALLDRCEAANGGAPITYFEMTTIVALLAFAEHPADAVLLETGLGGRLDATNVIASPAATAITRISFDHMQFLGDSIEAIAGEKAGILKPGTPAILARQGDDAVKQVIAARAAAIGAPLLAHGRDWHITSGPDHWRYDSAARSLSLPLPALPGQHQLDNAATALTCLDQYPALTVDEAAIRRGLATVRWPARLQRLQYGPLVDALPAGWELWLDGGHNDSGGEVLAVQAADWAAADDLPLFVIFGMLANKQPLAFLTPLVRHIAALSAVSIPGKTVSLTAFEAAQAAAVAGIAHTSAAEDVGMALHQLLTGAAARGQRPGRVLICGSLYLAGSILAHHG